MELDLGSVYTRLVPLEKDALEHAWPAHLCQTPKHWGEATLKS